MCSICVDFGIINEKNLGVRCHMGHRTWDIEHLNTKYEALIQKCSAFCKQFDH